MRFQQSLSYPQLRQPLWCKKKKRRKERGRYLSAKVPRALPRGCDALSGTFISCLSFHGELLSPSLASLHVKLCVVLLFFFFFLLSLSLSSRSTYSSMSLFLFFYFSSCTQFSARLTREQDYFFFPPLFLLLFFQTETPSIRSFFLLFQSQAARVFCYKTRHARGVCLYSTFFFLQLRFLYLFFFLHFCTLMFIYLFV